MCYIRGDSNLANSMSYHRINVITGWIVWAIATIVFVMTIEPTASFWDCGEFIASANGLQVGHPPGAPLWMMISRVFILFAPAGYEATAVNVLSALSSSFTILFLFWSITHMVKKVASKFDTESLGANVAVMGAGAIGALAYTFSDSFWFSSAEGEVYAMSSLFTAAVFWAILKWETTVTKENTGSLQWLILIAYLMGLSIGVHLLNLLTIPAIAFVYYFKRYDVTPLGVAITGAISLGLLGFIQVGIIQGLVNYAGSFELLFVNDFGLPFNSGVLIYAILILGSLFGLIYLCRIKRWVGLNTLFLGTLVCVIGYSSFALIVVRSSANPPMDENNPENLFALLSYLNREQYGDRPLTFGQYWTTPTSYEKPYTDGNPVMVKSYSIYKKGKKKDKLISSFRGEFEALNYIRDNGDGFYLKTEYIDSGEKKNSIPNYNTEFCGVFPRMYSTTGRHPQQYKQWSNYKEYNTIKGRERNAAKEKEKNDLELELQQLSYYASAVDDRELLEQVRLKVNSNKRQINKLNAELTPSFGENMQFFTSYQIGFMYLRYFMWNFSGKQNDVQGDGGIQDGNWLTGLDFIDEQRLGNRDQLPESQTNNNGLNHLFMLPLLLGLIGAIFHLMKAPKDFTIVGLLFLLTGLAIVVYLNQYPNQPRERDYAYVGSFYAFAFWIGLGAYSLYYAARKLSWADVGRIAILSLVGSVVIWLMESVTDSSNTLSYALFYMSLIASAAFAIATAFGQVLQGEMSKGIMALVICLPIPLMMAAEGWDDHSRADRYTGVDFAKNYLDSLKPNAIIFTNGDNDTFPLWYVQEVEGYRTDVRVVNLSLLNTDWYIDQMKRKAYNSDPVPFQIPEAKYRQGTRDIIILDHARNKRDDYIDLGVAMDICVNDSLLTSIGDSRRYSFIPSNKLRIPVDSAKVLANGTVNPEDADKIVPYVDWTIVDDKGRPKQYILKNAMMVLDLLDNNDWDRPVYFAVTTGMDAYMGMSNYFQLEGLAYRLVPIFTPESPNPNVLGRIATDDMYDNIMNKFQWGNMDDTTGIYLDENNKRMITNIRLQFGNTAEALADEGKQDMALAVLKKVVEITPEVNVPYDRVMLPIAENFWSLGPRDTLGFPPGYESELSEELQKEAQAEGKRISVRLFDIFEEDVEYFLSLEPKFASKYVDDMEIKMSVNNRLTLLYQFYAPDDEVGYELAQRLDSLSTQFEAKLQDIGRVEF